LLAARPDLSGRVDGAGVTAALVLHVGRMFILRTLGLTVDLPSLAGLEYVVAHEALLGKEGSGLALLLRLDRHPKLLFAELASGEANGQGGTICRGPCNRGRLETRTSRETSIGGSTGGSLLDRPALTTF